MNEMDLSPLQTCSTSVTHGSFDNDVTTTSILLYTPLRRTTTKEIFGLIKNTNTELEEMEKMVNIFAHIRYSYLAKIEDIAQKNFFYRSFFQCRN